MDDLMTSKHIINNSDLRTQGEKMVHNIFDNPLDNHPIFDDIFFKDFFSGTDRYFTNLQTAPKIKHPIDISTTSKGILFEIAAVGVERKDLDISVDGDTFRVEYKRPKQECEDMIHSGIKKSSFDVAFRVNSKYKIEDLKAELDKGILEIFIPLSEEKKPKKIKIN